MELRLRVEVEIEGVLTDLDGEFEKPRVLPMVTRVAVHPMNVPRARPDRYLSDEGEETAFATVTTAGEIATVVVTKGGSSPQWDKSGLPAKVRRRVNNLGVLAVQAFHAVNDQLESHEVEDLT